MPRPLVPPASLDASAMLSRLETILREGGELIEFWYDADTKVFFAGEHMGDTLPDAVLKLVTEGDHA